MTWFNEALGNSRSFHRARWPCNGRPDGVHSFWHVALPFPIEDAHHGVSDAVASPRIAVRKITLRGERGVLNIPASEILRLKHNPFNPYHERRVLAFLQLIEQQDQVSR